MQKGLNFPFRKYVRLSKESNTKLAYIVKKRGLRENVVLRGIIERGLDTETLALENKND